MGAPIAAVVLEELAGMGARVVLRAGTAMAVEPDDTLGVLVSARAAMRYESTSATYAPLGYPAVADLQVLDRTRVVLEEGGIPYREGLLASFDGFYTEMLAADEARREEIAARLAAVARLGVLAVDMETSAVLVVGAVLGVRVGSLCLVSVAAGGARLDERARREGEARLIQTALRSVTAVSVS
jgi:uridine phosphorylase